MGESRIMLIDICVSMSGVCCVIGYFIYDWGLKDGLVVCFECVDVFEFDVVGFIEWMIIVYDIYLICSMVGDKYV